MVCVADYFDSLIVQLHQSVASLPHVQSLQGKHDKQH